MPQKPLLQIKEGLNIQQDPDWCGVHALAKAQHDEWAHSATDIGQNGPQRQYRRNVEEQVIQTEVHDGFRQNKDDIPLVEQV